jgi:hypothetical protein
MQFKLRLVDLMRSYLRVQIIVIVITKVRELKQNRRAYMPRNAANLIGMLSQDSRDLSTDIALRTYLN